MGVVESCESSNKLLNFANSALESSKDLELLLNGLDLLGKSLLLVLGDGDAHGVEVVVNGGKEAIDAIISLLQDVLSLGEISIGSLKVEDLLDLLDLLLSKVELSGNGLAVLGIANEGLLSLIEKLKSVIGPLLGVLPSVLQTLDIGLKELGLVGVLEDDLTLGNKVCDNIPLGVQLGEGLLLSLNELINILNARGGNVSGGGKHDSIKELNMGFELITIGVALPVEIHHDSGLLDIGDQLLVLLNETFKLVVFLLLQVLGALSHQDLQDLSQPFLDLSPLQIFAERVESVSFSLELGRGVDLVGHDP